MTVLRGEDGAIALSGDCSVEDAETLLGLLNATPSAAIDWTLCEGAHTAVIQVLLAAGAVPDGPPLSQLLRDIVEPALKAR